MSKFSQRYPSRRIRPWRIALIAGIGILGALSIVGATWFLVRASQPREAPEAEAVLDAQSNLPFQVLIPAYLPPGFIREKVEIQTDRAGPQGEPMVQLIYAHPQGIQVAISEWIPQDTGASSEAHTCGSTEAGQAACTCICMRGNHGSTGSAGTSGLMTNVGPLRIRAETSHPMIVTRDLLGAILFTLAPPSGLEVTTSLEDVDLVVAMPPAVEIPLNQEGVQEVVLVVSPSGYTPAHFSVRAGVPVRLIFRQLGNVGCGNELLIQWGSRQQGRLVLSSPTDRQVLEFTPQTPGDFGFNCSHLIYQGVMTVEE
jgi:hypothetical protein